MKKKESQNKQNSRIALNSQDQKHMIRKDSFLTDSIPMNIDQFFTNNNNRAIEAKEKSRLSLYNLLKLQRKSTVSLPDARALDSSVKYIEFKKPRKISTIIITKGRY